MPHSVVLNMVRRPMQVDQRLVDAAIRQALERWPDEEAGAAAAYTADGRILTSVYVETPNMAVNLCHETGAICEAHKLNVAIATSVCVSRESKDAPFLILTPCGVCQERLAYWGGEVQVGVPQPDDPTKWSSRSLSEVTPFYWRKAIAPF